MKLNSNWFLILLLMFAFLPNTSNGQEDRKLKPLPDGTIRFDKFSGQPWSDIIEVYAKQAGLELDKVVPPPTGTFEFQGNRDMNYLEALDFLNEKLIPRERILIRKRHMLYLFSLGDDAGIPEEMIQTISPSELDQRGKYEFLQCQFDVKGLEASELRDQIEPLVDDKFRRYMTVVPYANLLMITDTGGRLRFIRDNIIEAAKQNADNWDAEYITLEYALPDDIIKAAEILGVNPETGRDQDGTLSITAHPHGDKILLMGDPAKIIRVKKLVEAINLPFTDTDDERSDPFYFSYRVEGNVELIHEVLQSMMSGRDINLDFDEKTNRIHLFGRQDDHDDVREVIEKTGSGSSNFSVVQVNIMDIEEAREKIEEAFGLGGVEAPEDAPTITELPPNRLVVRGNPGIVSEIEQMLKQIDAPFSREPGTRTTRRDISMSPAETDRIMGMLGDVLPSTGLNNQIDVVMPGEQKWKFNRSSRAFEIHRGDELLREIEEGQPQLPPTPPTEKPKQVPKTKDETSGTGNRVPKSSPINKGGVQKKENSFRFPKPKTLRWQHAKFDARGLQPKFQLISTRGLQQVEQEETPAPVTEQPASQEVETTESEPGAPITLYVNDRGITIFTKDLDAGDLLEDLIMDELSTTTGYESMKLFLLRYREAADAKAQLESYLGVSGGGGGGGGGMGDMMGNFMRNALPGAAGGMADALLGGGGGMSGGGAIRELAGEVTIVADAKQYSLLISALPEDMDFIAQLIDLIDQPTAIQNPNPNGNTYLIKINYMDPETLESMVRSNLAAVLKSSEDSSGQNRGGGNAEQRMQQQFLRAMLGRNGGGGGAGADQEAPKAALSVDTRNRMLVVTGPQFIVNLVEEFVALVDRPTETTPSMSEVLPVSDIDINLLAEILQAQNPNIVLMVDENQTSNGNSSTGQSGSSSSGGRTASGGSNPMSSEAFRNAIMQGMRNRGGSTGGRGSSGRGGSTGGRGSGGRGGGGRGGSGR